MGPPLGVGAALVEHFEQVLKQRLRRNNGYYNTIVFDETGPYSYIVISLILRIRMAL